MNPAHVSIIDKNIDYLVLNMDTMRVLDHLLSSGTLLSGGYNKIRRMQHSDERNRELLEILKQTSEPSYEKFLEALYNTQQYALVEKLRATVPAIQSTLGAAGGPPTQTNPLTTPHLNEEKKGGSKFKVFAAVKNIVSKFEGYSDEQKNNLKIPMNDKHNKIFQSSLDGARTQLCADLHVSELLNGYLLPVLPKDKTAAIKKAEGTTEATTILFDAVRNTSVMVLMMFIIGLQNTNQEHFLRQFCTEEFCSRLLSILEEECDDE